MHFSSASQLHSSVHAKLFCLHLHGLVYFSESTLAIDKFDNGSRWKETERARERERERERESRERGGRERERGG